MSTLRSLATLLVLLLVSAAPGAAQQIDRTSHTDGVFLYNTDFRSAYASFVVTNDTGALLTDVSVEIALPGPAITLGDLASAVYDIGDLAAGESAPAFFYLKTTVIPPTGPSSQNEVSLAPTETFSVEVYEGTALKTSDSFDFRATRNTIAANSNKINSISSGLAGSILTVTVEGETGNVTAGMDVNFSPAVLDDWNAADWKLLATEVDFESGTQVLTNELAAELAQGAPGQGLAYVATYKFELLQGFPTIISSTTWVDDGGQGGGSSDNSPKHAPLDPTATGLADLSITKKVDNDTPFVGESITFTVTVSNVGPAATGVVVEDLLVGGVVCFDDVVADPPLAGGAWTIDVPAGTTGSPGVVELTLTGTVICDQSFINTAAITDTGDLTDVDPTNNGPAEVEVDPQTPPVDLMIGKEIIAIDVDKTSPNYGQVTYRLSVTNLGTVPATGNSLEVGSGERIIVRDPLSADFVFVSSTEASQPLGFGMYDETTGNWGLSTIGPGETKFIDITVALAAPSGPLPATIDNTATLDPATVDQGDSVASNNSATARLLIADIAVEKTVDDATPNEGQEITFTITVANNGGSDVSSISIEDILSDDTGLSNITPSWGAGTWDFGPLAAGASAEATLTATVTGPVAFTNMATVVALPGDILDPIAENNMGMVDVVPNALDLEVGKAAEILDELAGEIRYTLTVTNLGPADATNIVLIDTPPTALDGPAIPDAGDAFTAGPGSGEYTWTVDALAPGESASVEYQVICQAPDCSDPVKNTVTLAGVDQFETNDANDMAMEIVPSTDISVEKTVTDKDGNPIDPSMLLVGEVIAFEIKVTNNGPADVTNVMVKDELTIFHPDGSSEIVPLFDIIDYPNSVVSPGSQFDPWNTPQWVIPTLSAGDMETLFISGKLKAAHEFKNVAFLMGISGAIDLDSSNNMAMVLSTPKAVDVAISKEIIAIDRDKESATYGHVTYRLSAENLSEIEATGNDASLGAGLRFIINDPLSPDFMFVSSTQMMGALDLGYGKYDESTGQWGLNQLEPGKTKFIDITVKLVDPANAPALIENTATLDPSTLNEFEKNAGNDSASATLLIADIAVEKAVDDATPNEGQEITFTITVTNNGGSDVSNLSIEDILSNDSGLSNITPSWGAGTWDFGPLTARQSAEATVSATVTGAVDFTNTASLVELPSDVLDPIAENNMGMVDVVPNRVDIAVGKSFEILDELSGRVRFTITATNFGPQDATGLDLTDTPDAAILVDLGTVSGDGTFDGTLWSLAALANGATATLTFEADISSADVLAADPINALDLTAVDQFEIELPDSSDNPAAGDEHAEVAVPAADILVEKSVDNSTPELWETITFTVKVTNQGPSAASNVMIKDPIKDALTGALVAIVIDKSTGSFDLNSGTWTIPALASGAMATLTVTGEVSDAATFKNTATLMGLEGAVDYNAANNMAMATVEPVGADAIDLELVKTADVQTAEVGDIVTFSITVTNSTSDGPVIDATGIIVSDYLPAGLDYVWDTATSPADDARVVSVNQNALRWTISSLSADESITLSFQAEVSGTGDLINVAEIWDVDQAGLDRDSQTGAEGGAFDPLTNPADAEDDQDDAQIWAPEPAADKADLSLTKTVNDSAPKVGDKITFTVTVANIGAPTNGIQVRDTLTDSGGCFEISLSHVTVSHGVLSVLSSGGYMWVLNLDADKSATLTLEGWVRCKAWFSNEAEIVSSGSLADVSSGNDWAGVEVRPTGGIITPPPSGDALCYLVADNDAEGQPSNDVLTALYNGSTQDVKVGHTGTQMIEAIAFNPWNRQLYAADARRLGVLDLQTGAFAALGHEFGAGWGLDEFGQPRSRGFLDVDGLAFDPYGGDKLFGTVRKTGESDLLIRIDPNTGKHVPNAFGQDRDYVTIQGVYGLTDIDDIAISPWDGTLYAINNRDGMQSRLVRLDRQTGVATKVLDLPLGNVEGLGFFGDGTMYGTAGEGDESLVVIHLSSGTATVQAGIGAGGRDYESVDCLTNKTNRLAVTVFGDANGDGIMQMGEAPSAGIAVELQRDVDGDGAGDLVLAETTTTADGAAIFDAAATGSFVLVPQLAGATAVQTAFEGFGAAETAVLGMTATSTAGESEAALPEGFALGQNYPNPFNPVTTIGFSMGETSTVYLAVYDVLGREVAVLVDGVQSAGQHEVRFDAAGLQTGTYLYRLSVDGRVAQTRQLVLMK